MNILSDSMKDFLHFKDKDMYERSQFYAYCVYKSIDMTKLLIDYKLDKEEIDSALYSQFVIERKKYKKHIINMQHTILDFVIAIQKSRTHSN